MEDGHLHQESERKNFKPVVKATIVVLALLLIGYFATTAAKRITLLPAAVTAPAKDTAIAPVPLSPEQRGPAQGASKRDAVKDKSGPIDDSRECKVEEGIVTHCIFN